MLPTSCLSLQRNETDFHLQVYIQLSSLSETPSSHFIASSKTSFSSTISYLNVPSLIFYFNSIFWVYNGFFSCVLVTWDLFLFDIPWLKRIKESKSWAPGRTQNMCTQLLECSWLSIIVLTQMRTLRYKEIMVIKIIIIIYLCPSLRLWDMSAAKIISIHKIVWRARYYCLYFIEENKTQEYQITDLQSVYFELLLYKEVPKMVFKTDS